MLQELDDRDKFLEALLEKYNVTKAAEAKSVAPGAPLALEEAIRVIQNNERGRQAREKARLALMYKKQRQLQDKRSK
jgi:IQ and AAA domain-containing protein